MHGDPLQQRRSVITLRLLFLIILTFELPELLRLGVEIAETRSFVQVIISQASSIESAILWGGI